MRYFNFFLCFVVFLKSLYGSEEPQGWNWYQEKDLEVPLERKEETPQKRAPQTATERLNLFQKHFEEVKARAVLEPTLGNVLEAKRVHDGVIRKGVQFKDAWMLAELLEPQDYSRNTSPGALKIQRDLDEKALDHDLRVLSKTHGLIFVFREGCPYCEDFAPLVLKFAKKYGFEVEGLSEGPGTIEGMPSSQNLQAFAALNPEGEVPMLFLVNPENRDVMPLARGYVNWKGLRSNALQAIEFLRKHR